MKYKRLDFVHPVPLPGSMKTRTRFVDGDGVHIYRDGDTVSLVTPRGVVEVPWVAVQWAEVEVQSKSQERRLEVQKQPDPLPSEPETAKKSGRTGKTKKSPKRARRPRAKKD